MFERANALYWSANATYDSAACGVESSADDLGYSSNDVIAAFTAVDVSCPSNPGGGGSGGGSGGGALSNGVAVAVPSIASGNMSGDYTVAIPAGASNLSISISGGSGDADLYVKFAAQPTSSSYDCRPYMTGNNEQCPFATPSVGTYHVKVSAYQAIANVTLKATWDTAGGGGGNPGSGSLSNAVPVNLPSTSAGNFTGDYTVSIPAGASNLQIGISGGSGDADLYARFAAAPTTSTYDCRPYKTGNTEQCTFATPSAGTYHVKVHAYASFANVQLVAIWDTSSGGGGGGSGSNGVYDNPPNINVPAHGTASSSINVSGEASTGPTDLQVHVEVVHSYRGDVRVTLIAPDGGSVVLKDPDGSDGAANVNTTWTVNASSINPNGTWKLKVDDVYTGDSGYIDDFKLTF
ncbi:MAG: pre-peptidase C-terminal domain-containing protein [Xanthomonadales bacterium]|nr:pre-peptidase C-terminal domain-containing protein [Xanthomonadales bacterium]